MTATLYSLTLSPPTLAARCMLEHKAIDHRVVDLVPGTQPVALRMLRFRGATVPALVIDGRRIQGSRAISRALDGLRPDPPLFPRDPAARRRVEEAERWGELVLQKVPRRVFRWMAANHYDVRRWLAVEASSVPLGALLARPPLQARLFARASGADDATVRADLVALGDHLAEVERLRATGVIGGLERNAADFQIAASLRSIGKFGDLAPHLDDHPAVRWAATVVPALPGPVPSVLPREWLRPLATACGQQAVGRTGPRSTKGGPMEGQPTRKSIDDEVEGPGDEGRRTAETTPPIADDAEKGQTEAPPEPGDVGVPSDEEIGEDEG